MSASTEKQKTIEEWSVQIATRQNEIVEEIKNLRIKSFWSYLMKLEKIQGFATEWIANDMVEGLSLSEHFNVNAVVDAFRILSGEKQNSDPMAQCEFDYILRKSIVKLECKLPREIGWMKIYSVSDAQRFYVGLLLLANAFLSLNRPLQFIPTVGYEKVFILLHLIIGLGMIGSVLAPYLSSKQYQDRSLRGFCIKNIQKYAPKAVTEEFSKQLSHSR